MDEAGESGRFAGLCAFAELLAGCAELGGGGEDFSDNGVDVGFGSAVVDDAGAEREMAVDGGVGEIDAAATIDAIENAAVEVVKVEGRWVAR